MRRAPSRQISSSVDAGSPRVDSSVTTLNIGVPSSPARQRQRLLVKVNEEGTPRHRTGDRPTTSGHTSHSDDAKASQLESVGAMGLRLTRQQLNSRLVAGVNYASALRWALLTARSEGLLHC
jgi:hypothetical protein